MTNRTEQNRREFLQFMGKSGAALSLAGLTPILSQCQSTKLRKSSALPFIPLSPTDKDDLVLASGFNYEVLIQWGDKLNSKGDEFGFNNDYTAFFPLKPGDSSEGLLWVNHESVQPVFVSGYTGQKKSKKQVLQEQKAVGGSIVHIRKTKQGWTVVQDDKYNRRIDATTKIPFAPKGKVKGQIFAVGTHSNCAGGVTPWRTVLTCEENYDDFYGETVYKNGKAQHRRSDREFLTWEDHFPYPPEHYGWVVEVNPFSGEAKKLTALGRFAHECATTVTAKDGRCVVYMGDDSNDECVYKFISAKPDSLEEGELFVANIEKGEWISLNRNKHPVLKKNFKSQKEVLVRCRDAARLVGGTPLDRPEDIEIDPDTKTVFVTQTNNKPKGNYHGSLLKIEEEGGDHLAMKFKASIFLAGGKNTGFSSPDNLVFDPKGNLWLTCDISGGSMNKGVYKPFKNNGLFYIPLKGELAGQVFQVGSAPRDAEFTGPTFTKDGKTLFLSVQHPGELTRSLDKLTSNWPSGKKGEWPRPAVVTVSGPALEKLTT
jgi:secreted PhoX family phosphatase